MEQTRKQTKLYIETRYSKCFGDKQIAIWKKIISIFYTLKQHQFQMTRKEKLETIWGIPIARKTPIILTQNPETIRERINKLGDEKKKTS